MVASPDFTRIKALVGLMPPVFGIHLGSLLDNQGQPDQAASQLIQLTQLTGGQFYRVTPTDTVSMRLAMENIISRVIAKAVFPLSLQIQNSITGQISRAVSGSDAADGNLNVTLDSSLALQKGNNTFQVSITRANNTVHNYSFQIQSGDEDAVENSPSLACYDPSALTLLNAKGQLDPAYPATTKSYSIQLKRSPSELSGVTIKAISSDTLKALRLGRRRVG